MVQVGPVANLNLGTNFPPTSVEAGLPVNQLAGDNRNSITADRVGAGVVLQPYPTPEPDDSLTILNLAWNTNDKSSGFSVRLLRD